MAKHELAIKESTSSRKADGFPRRYFNASCTCGWMTGTRSRERAEEAYQEHLPPEYRIEAAAPDMLAALRAIAGLENQTKADCIGLLKQARHIAKCTLAKAEGRSNG